MTYFALTSLSMYDNHRLQEVCIVLSYRIYFAKFSAKSKTTIDLGIMMTTYFDSDVSDVYWISPSPLISQDLLDMDIITIETG